MKLMRYLGLSSLKSKLLLTPCKKMMQLFSKLRLRKPVCIRSLRFRRRRRLSKRERERELDRATELTSFTSQYQEKAPHPSPLTPAYVRTMRKVEAPAAALDDAAEDACRSFEKYLMEMVVDEKGKMRDLGDVEELLYCWRELRSPVFLDLVCRFYRELCTDLFSTA